jgi:hypothetical protein
VISFRTGNLWVTRTTQSGACKPRNPFTLDTLHAVSGHGNASAPNASLWIYPGSGIARSAASTSGSSTPAHSPRDDPSTAPKMVTRQLGHRLWRNATTSGHTEPFAPLRRKRQLIAELERLSGKKVTLHDTA